ncbi:MAG: alpha-1,3-fucosyltransferase [Rickettsiaceae bacterium]|nr:alpha-1,3-fucosyltransferase [Rickettsiaceae bacterium]
MLIKRNLNKFVNLVLLAILIISIVIFSYFDKSPAKKEELIRVSYINQWPGFELSELPMIKELLEEKFNKVVIDHQNYDLIIDGYFGEEEISNKDAVKLYFVGEAFRPDIEKYDLSIGFNRITHEKYMRIPLYYMYYSDKISTNFKREPCNPNKEYFACMLVSNPGRGKPRAREDEGDRSFDGCVARDRAFHQISLYKRVASGGRHLNNLDGYIVPIPQTDEWLSKCKFIISYENQKYDGYVTEKPFQSYLAGAVPIYYAEDNYHLDVNPESVIFAGDYDSEEEMVEYIKKVDNDDDLYCKIYNSPMVPKEEQNYEQVKKKLGKKLYKLIDAKK